MKLGVIGGGVVGSARARSFLEHAAEVRVYDVQKQRATHTLLEVLECDLIFICLPTPQSADGSADISAIEQFCANHRGYTKNFVLKSTVPIGTTRLLRERYELPNLIHSPEFLTARCAFTDAQMPSRNIIGAPGNCECAIFLKELYQTRFPGVPVLRMYSDESEAVKLVLNSFFAVKVGFFSEVNALAEKLDLNWNRIMEAVLADGRIAYSHTRVPGPDGKKGFGGTCLPKDLSNLVTVIEAAGLPASITRAARERNAWDRQR